MHRHRHTASFTLAVLLYRPKIRQVPALKIDKLNICEILSKLKLFQTKTEHTKMHLNINCVV